MKRTRTIWIIVVTAFCLLIALLWYRLSDKKQVSWYALYRESGQQPYDLSVMSTLLQHYYPANTYTTLHQSIAATLPLAGTAKSSYVFIGAQLYFAEKDVRHLREFVLNGNDAFIAAEVLPAELFDSIIRFGEFPDYHLPFFADSVIRVDFSHPSLFKTSAYRFDYIFEWKNEINHWNYFPDSMISAEGHPCIQLASANDSFINFIKVPYGKGAFYLYSTPLCFCNYYLLQPDALEHAEKVFSHLSASNIYWDEFSKVPQRSPGNRGDTETPLRYILSQTSLRWAWYVLLSMTVLFLLFRARRDQRIIPVVEQYSNTSLEFIQTIGSLYLQQHNHRALALQKMKLFQLFLRQRYGLPTKVMDQDFVNKLAEKSQVQKGRITAILDDFQTIENMQVISRQQLEALHAALYSFYKSCK